MYSDKAFWKERRTMDSTVLVAIISGVCTLLGSSLGVLASAKLSNYRIGQLEKKVEKHNSLVERMYHLEEKDAVVDEQIKTVNRRISDLERKVKVEQN